MPDATAREDAAAPRLAIIAGSGFGEFAGDAPKTAVLTRYGEPSAPVRTVSVGGRPVRVLLRHGDRHEFPPHAINYRANLAALSRLGVEQVIGLNTVGVIPARPQPGNLAVPDQLIDYSWGRVHSFHAEPCANFAHVDFSAPFADDLRRRLLAAAAAAGLPCHDGGVYGVTQGPRLETAAEVDRYERDGVHFLGMTGMPEAALATELGIGYAMLCLVVNRAAGRGSQAIHADIEENTMTARQGALRVLEQLIRDDGSLS